MARKKTEDAVDGQDVAGAPKVAPVKVRANAPGLYGKYREAGEEFHIAGDVHPDTVIDADGKEKPHPKAGKVKAFSDKWMELVDED